MDSDPYFAADDVVDAASHCGTEESFVFTHHNVPDSVALAISNPGASLQDLQAVAAAPLAVTAPVLPLAATQALPIAHDL